MNKIQCIKIRGYPKISVAKTGLKSGWKCGLKRWFSVTGTVPAPNTGSWRSNLQLNCYKFSSVGPGLSHEPNASNRTQNSLRTSGKQSLNFVRYQLVESDRRPKLEPRCEGCRRVVLIVMNPLFWNGSIRAWNERETASEMLL